MEEATRLAARKRVGARYVAIGALLAAFVILSVLYVGGRFDRLDSYALEHWMHGLEPESDTDKWPAISGLFMPFSLDSAWWEALLGLVGYPASALVSFLVFATCCVVLWRRGARFPALAWGLSWFAANAIEVGLKASLMRPPLHAVDAAGVEHHLRGFDHAFPSGHTVRAVMVAGLLVYVSRRLLAPAVLWALAVPVALVLGGAHVPADTLGGIVFGLLAVVVTWTVADSPRLESWCVARWALLRGAPGG